MEGRVDRSSRCPLTRSGHRSTVTLTLDLGARWLSVTSDLVSQRQHRHSVIIHANVSGRYKIEILFQDGYKVHTGSVEVVLKGFQLVLQHPVFRPVQEKKNIYMKKYTK